MYRFGLHVYKPHYACFKCRKMFRPAALQDLPEFNRPNPTQPRLVPCPECGQPMHNMGRHFKAPRQHNVQQWRKVEILYANGLTWHDWGRPVKAYLEKQKRWREEEEQARQKRIKKVWREAKEKRHHSFRKPPPVQWEFYAVKTSER